MNLPKFIITLDGVFHLGIVNQHKNLLKPGDQCIGGGYYRFDYTSNRIILDRSSYDFGKPKWHLIDTHLDFEGQQKFSHYFKKKLEEMI